MGDAAEQSGAPLWIAGEAEADALLSEDPLALLVGMLLDQQIPLERAFRAPLELARRLEVERAGEGAAAASASARAPGARPGLDVEYLAGMDPERLAGIFCQSPALHRFPAAMAGRVQELCRIVVRSYGGRADAVWSTVTSGEELIRRLTGLPGFGPRKAQIFAALLGKQRGVRPPGWREAAGEFGEEGVLRSVADVTGPDSLVALRAAKKVSKQARTAS